MLITILNHLITITKVPHADKPKLKVFEWTFHVKGEQFGGYSDTQSHALNDASICLYDQVRKHNLV